MPPTPSRAVLITGCSSGIGAATAAISPRLGWTVYATARRPETLARAGGGGLPHARARRHRRGLDAGRGRAPWRRSTAPSACWSTTPATARPGAVETVPLERRPRASSRRTCSASCACASSSSPAMRAQRWGKIVNVSSMGGRFTFPGAGHYHATQARGGGDLRRAALRGPRLRRRRDRRSSRGSSAPASASSRARSRGHRGRRPLRATSTPRSKTAYVRDLREGPAARGSAARPRRSPSEIEQGDRRHPPARPLHGDARRPRR